MSLKLLTCIKVKIARNNYPTIVLTVLDSVVVIFYRRYYTYYVRS